MEFAMEVIMDKQALAAFRRAVPLRAPKVRKGRIVFIKVASFIIFLEALVLGLGGLWGLVSNIIYKSLFDIYPAILAVILGFLLSVFFLFMWCDPLTNWISWKNYKHKGIVVSFRFMDTEFWNHTSASDERCDYAVIEDVLEDKGYYFLFIGNGAAYILRKDSFTSGDPAEFRDFIAEKLGKAVKQI